MSGVHMMGYDLRANAEKIQLCGRRWRDEESVFKLLCVDGYTQVFCIIFILAVDGLSQSMSVPKKHAERSRGTKSKENQKRWSVHNYGCGM